MNLLENVLNFFYPNTCGICEKVCNLPICNNCMNRINKKLISGRKVYIQTKDRYFDEHIYLFRYTDTIRDLIISYKFNEKSYLYKTFSYMILNNKKIMKCIKKYNIITCVPIHKKRKKFRGYNQSELIIKDVCKKDKNLNYTKNILIKTKNIKPLSSLNKEDRAINILNAYEINTEQKKIIKDKKILIFDDIFTTGSTANECAKVLKEYGAKKVGILTIARD